MVRPAVIPVPGFEARRTRALAVLLPHAWAVAALVAGGGLVAYVTLRVMVTMPRLGRDDALRHWPVAVLGAAIVALGAAVVVSWATGRRRAATDGPAHNQLSFTLFTAIVLVQIVHMFEHTTQVVQLLTTEGDLSRARGMIGRLDFETVHFSFDTTLWIALGAFLVVWRGDNRWLWIAFAFASVHEVEHVYLLDVPSRARSLRAGWSGRDHGRGRDGRVTARASVPAFHVQPSRHRGHGRRVLVRIPRAACRAGRCGVPLCCARTPSTTSCELGFGGLTTRRRCRHRTRCPRDPPS